VIKAPAYIDSTFGSKIVAFKNELLKNPSVKGITGSSDIPGKLIMGKNTIRKASDDKTHNYITYIMQADENFLTTFQMQAAAGRNFSQSDSFDFQHANYPAIMVNEEVVSALGYKNNEAAIHQPVIFGLGPGEIKAEIVGVVKDYHQRSLREKYDPIIYLYPSGNYWSYLSIHINTANLEKNLASIGSSYKTIFSGNPFEYFFLDEYFNNQYEADQRFGKVFSLFTILAIFVACLGLLGLSSFLSRLRTKEIGIRKVLGANAYSILILFSKEFVKLVCIASLIAMPIFYFAANMWLRNYAFHIQVNVLMLLTPPLLLLCIALLTTSIESIRAALANPVTSIRSE